MAARAGMAVTGRASWAQAALGCAPGTDEPAAAGLCQAPAVGCQVLPGRGYSTSAQRGPGPFLAGHFARQMCGIRQEVFSPRPPFPRSFLIIPGKRECMIQLACPTVAVRGLQDRPSKSSAGEDEKVSVLPVGGRLWGNER